MGAKLIPLPSVALLLEISQDKLKLWSQDSGAAFIHAVANKSTKRNCDTKISSSNKNRKSRDNYALLISLYCKREINCSHKKRNVAKINRLGRRTCFKTDSRTNWGCLQRYYVSFRVLCWRSCLFSTVKQLSVCLSVCLSAHVHIGNIPSSEFPVGYSQSFVEHGYMQW
jgi:hypothetical protein